MAECRKPPAVGEFAKVWIPGETPWAECIAVYDDGTWDGRIANRLFGERSEFERVKIVRDWFPGSPATALPSLYNYKQNQVIRWCWANNPQGSEYWVWEPREWRVSLSGPAPGMEKEPK